MPSGPSSTTTPISVSSSLILSDSDQFFEALADSLISSNDSTFADISDLLEILSSCKEIATLGVGRIPRTSPANSSSHCT